uniref:G-protein coupled receptors family 1 profile domain-containing protein n=1 Tax=Tetranychus urticae TaxID=32264 RepID=T1L273_TETUR
MDLIGGSTTSFNLTADAVTNLTLLLFYSLPNILNVSSTRESSTVYLDTRRNNNSDYKHDSPHYHSHSHLNGESPFFPPISSFLSSSSNCGLTDLTIGLTSSNVTENQVSSDWWSSSLSPSVIFKSNETIFTFNASQDNDGEPSFPVEKKSIGLTPFNASNHVNQLVIEYNWFYLMLGLLVFVGCFGNILVCLAICLERRLQNATNFFLLSLAIADLLVSILVMPMSIVNEVYGKHCSFTLKTKLPSTLNSVSS